MESLKKSLTARAADLRDRAEALQNQITVGMAEVKHMETQRATTRAKIEEIERTLKMIEEENQNDHHD